MRVQDGCLVMETRPCLCVNGPCPDGRAAGKQACSACGGTGNGKRGGKGSCRSCHGFGTQPDFVNHVPCVYCEGTASVAETLTDSLPTAIWQSLPFVVMRADRRQTWNEEHFGAGCCWSSTDYGRAWNETDADLLARVRDTTSRVQACKVADRNGRLCDFVAIVLMPNGYTVKGAWRNDPTPAAVDRVTERALSR